MLKYQQAEQQIAKLVDRLSQGDALPPIRKLMEEFCLSQVTVVKAVSLLEQRGLLERRRGAGVFVARKGAVKGCSVAVMMSTLDNRTSAKILQGIQEELSRNGMQLRLFSCDGNPGELLPLWEKEGIERLVLYPNTPDLTRASFLDFANRLNGRNIQVATIEVPVPGLKCAFVGQENTRAFSEVTSRLLARNVRKIAVVGHLGSVIYASRLAGIREAISRVGETVALTQLDLGGGEGEGEIARQVLSSGCQAAMLCNSESSRDIAYELAMLSGASMPGMVLAGVVEQDARMPLENAVTMEKQSKELGIAAVRALNNAAGSPAEYLPMKIHYPAMEKPEVKRT